MDRSVWCQFQWSVIYSLIARSYPELEYCPLVYVVLFLMCGSPEGLIYCVYDVLFLMCGSPEGLIYCVYVVLFFNVWFT